MKADFSNIKMLPNQDISIRLTSAHKQTVCQGWDVGWETHSSFEILKVIDGCQHSTFSNQDFLLYEGAILILPPDFPHHNICKNQTGLTYFCAHFNIDEPLLKYALNQALPTIITPSKKDYQTIDQPLLKWIKLLDKESPFTLIDNLNIQIIFTELSISLANFFIGDTTSPTASTEVHYADELATLIKNNFNSFVHDSGNEISQKLSISSMIHEIGISQNHAINVFKKVYGLTPKNYLDNLKYQEAKILLQYPFYSIEEISTRIGYSTPSHFSRQFKTWSDGISPLQYRKIHQ